jgi:hypothetical protein
VSTWLAVALACAAATTGLGAGAALRRPHPAGLGTAPCQRILLPFTGPGIPRRVLDAALRLAIAEHATLMPAYLARVPRQLPLDARLPRQSGLAMPLLEAIDQAATREGVPVDARVARGRTFRHALENLLAEETVDRVVVPASADPHSGLSGSDLVWLLERAPAEVLILRPRVLHAVPRARPARPSVDDGC